MKGGDYIKKFSIIYADCPWTYKAWSKRGKGMRVALNHYNTMTTEELCALPISEICEKDCVLFMWTTFPQLFDCLKVINAWQFEYKTCGFVWLKTNKKSEGYFLGLGHYTRSNAEICLIATRGTPPKRVSNKVRQLLISPIEQHSKKPDCTRDRIVELYGDLPRLELFARQRAPGWDAIGNEIDGKDIRDALREFTA